MSINTVNIIPFSFTEMGRDFHPQIAKEMQKRRTAAAIEVISKNADDMRNSKFRWTSDCTNTALEYLRSVDKADQNQFFGYCAAGYVDVGALAYNPSPVLNDDECAAYASWLSQDVADACKPKSIMVNRVGGVPARAVISACKNGAEYLWVGIDEKNAYVGKDTPFFFNWKLSATDRIFTWCCDYSQSLVRIFGGQSLAADDISELFATDFDNLDHKWRCLKEYLAVLESGSCGAISAFPLPLYTGSDMPEDAYKAVYDFVNEWNDAGFKPALGFATLTEAMRSVGIELANSGVPTYTGVWNDVVGGCVASCPQNISEVRDVKRLVKAISYLPSFNKKTDGRIVENAVRELCAFDENTHSSIENGCELYKIARIQTAKARLELLYNDAVKVYFTDSKQGVLYVFNPTMSRYNGSISIPKHKLHDGICAVENTATKKTYPLFVGETEAHFFADLAPKALHTFSFTDVYTPDVMPLPTPDIHTDENGFPNAVRWSSNKLEFDSIGEFMSVCVDGETKRGIVETFRLEKNPEKRRQLVGHYMLENKSMFGVTTATENDISIIFSQPFSNACIKDGIRSLTVYKNEPRVSLKVSFERPSGDGPEAYYLHFSIKNCSSGAVVSNGGQAYEVGRGQLELSGFDSYVTDGWVSYPYSDIVWISKDAPVVAFGDTHYFDIIQSLQGNINDIYSCIYDNCTSDLYPQSICGKMSFTYDVFNCACDDFTRIKALSDDIYMKPVTYFSKGKINE